MSHHIAVRQHYAWSWTRVQCLHTKAWMKRLNCHAGCQDVNRCHTTGESGEPVAHRWQRTQVKEFTLALKPRTDMIRSPKQRYQWPHKKDLCPPKIKKIWAIPLYRKFIKLWLFYGYRYENTRLGILIVFSFDNHLGDPKELEKKMMVCKLSWHWRDLTRR